MSEKEDSIKLGMDAINRTLEKIATATSEKEFDILYEELRKEIAAFELVRGGGMVTPTKDEIKKRFNLEFGKVSEISSSSDITSPRGHRSSEDGGKIKRTKTKMSSDLTFPEQTIMRGIDIGGDALLQALRWIEKLVTSSQSLPLNGVVGGLFINHLLWRAKLIDNDFYATTNASLHNILGVDISQRNISLVQSVLGLIPVVGGLTTRPPPDLLLTATLQVKADSDVYSRPSIERQAAAGVKDIEDLRGLFAAGIEDTRGLLALLKLLPTAAAAE